MCVYFTICGGRLQRLDPPLSCHRCINICNFSLAGCFHSSHVLWITSWFLGGGSASFVCEPIEADSYNYSYSIIAITISYAKDIIDSIEHSLAHSHTSNSQFYISHICTTHASEPKTSHHITSHHTAPHHNETENRTEQHIIAAAATQPQRQRQ